MKRKLNNMKEVPISGTFFILNITWLFITNSYSIFIGLQTIPCKNKYITMGLTNLFTGTLCAILLFILPASMKLSESQLVSKSQPIVSVDYAVGSTATPNMACAIIEDMIQVRPPMPRVRRTRIVEAEGNVQDGHIVHFPAPT